MGLSSTPPPTKSKFWLAKDDKEDKEWTQVSTKNKKKKKVDVGGNNKDERPSFRDPRQKDAE